MKFRKKRARELKQKNQKKVFNHTKRRTLRYYNVSRDENSQRGNEMDRPSLEGFHAQLDFKLTKGNKNHS